MTISDLIRLLNAHLDSYGDMPIVVMDSEHGDWSADPTVFYREEKNRYEIS